MRMRKMLPMKMDCANMVSCEQMDIISKACRKKKDQMFK